MRRPLERMKACDAMSPKRKEEFLAMILEQGATWYELLAVRHIWGETEASMEVKSMLMFQYGIIIGKRMERMKRRECRWQK